ncbi:glycosyltransferase [Aeromonas caviae]|uniref:glycosyltransferase family 2 protein n=1 Tax=Aeromonas caviae TaxID=648 RepID=UPI000B144529|nr:glycosyltransferase [Aeromonas caviae]AUU21587.1 glycosyl transferase [Aeromonas caviae]QOK20558.1 glycosyltransferase [Aeromonas caviae]
MCLNRLTLPSSEQEIIDNWLYVDKVYVSVICIAYNQELYIADAIESFLAQKTNFSFEIVIHDDFSTDKTREILLSYKERFPSIINLVFQDENQYSKGKKITPLAVKHAQGEYIALCEGDDFWVDSFKIQKQVTCLLADKSLSLVHTGSYDLVENVGKMTVSVVPSPVNTTKSLFNRNRIRTLTTMFPKKHFDEFFLNNETEASKWLLGDWPLWIYFSTVGKIAYIPDATSVYRILSESASNFTCNKKKEEFLKSTLHMRLYMHDKYLSGTSYLREIFNSYAKETLFHGASFPQEHIYKLSFLYKSLIFLNKIGLIRSLLQLRVWLRRCAVYLCG